MSLLATMRRMALEAADAATHAETHAPTTADQGVDEAHGHDAVHVAHETPHTALLFLFFSLAFGAVVRTVLLRVKGLPYTVVLASAGILIGILDSVGDLGALTEPIKSWANINPHLLMFVFLPALIFESAFSFDWHTFKMCFWQVMILAGPGVLINVAITTPCLKYLFPYDWTWKFSLMFASILSATDPVAVVALLKELGASKKLGTIVDGEALLNDGVAIVLFTLFFEMAKGDSKTAADITVFFIKVPLGAVAIGIAFFAASIFWLERVWHDAQVEISITVIGCYLAFYVAEEFCGVSGVLAVVVLGVLLSAYGKPYFAGEVEHSLHHFWEMVSYVANTIIFILAGVIIAKSFSLGDQVVASAITWTDFGYSILLYLLINVVRGLTIAICFPALKRMGYGLDFANAFMLCWGGLRGAVGLALALIVYAEPAFNTNGNGHRVLFHTGMMCVYTLLINGSTAAFVLDTLHLKKSSVRKDEVLASVMREMRETSMNQYLSHFRDDRLGAADFDMVQEYVTLLKPEEPKVYQPGIFNKFANRSATTGHKQLHHSGEASSHSIEEGHADLNASIDVEVGIMAPPSTPRQRAQSIRRRVTKAVINLFAEGDKTEEQVLVALIVDARTRLLESVKVFYWELLESGSLYKRVHFMLQHATDVALDHPKQGSVEWRELRAQMSTGGDLPEASLLATDAFIQAHANAEHELKATISTQSNPSLTEVIEESQRQCAEAREFLKELSPGSLQAREFLKELRSSHPEVLAAVKSKAVARHLLAHQLKYVEKVTRTGLLDEKEAEHLKHEVERDIKTLAGHPPKVKSLSSDAILRQTAIIELLPYKLRNDMVELLISNNAKSGGHISKQQGDYLFHANDEATCLWIVGRGVVDIKVADGISLAMGSRSHTFGWGHGSYDMLASIAFGRDAAHEASSGRRASTSASASLSSKSLGSKAVWRYDYTAQATSPIVCWRLEKEQLQKILSEGGQPVEEALWKNCLSTMSEAGILEGPLGEPISGVLSVLTEGSLIRLGEGEDHITMADPAEKVVLVHGEMVSDAFGDAIGPCVLRGIEPEEEGAAGAAPGAPALKYGSPVTFKRVPGSTVVLIRRMARKEMGIRPMLGMVDGDHPGSPSPGRSPSMARASYANQLTIGRSTMTMPGNRGGEVATSLRLFLQEQEKQGGSGAAAAGLTMPSRQVPRGRRLPSFDHVPSEYTVPLASPPPAATISEESGGSGGVTTAGPAVTVGQGLKAAPRTVDRAAMDASLAEPSPPPPSPAMPPTIIEDDDIPAELNDFSDFPGGAAPGPQTDLAGGDNDIPAELNDFSVAAADGSAGQGLQRVHIGRRLSEEEMSALNDMGMSAEIKSSFEAGRQAGSAKVKDVSTPHSANALRDLFNARDETGASPPPAPSPTAKAKAAAEAAEAAEAEAEGKEAAARAEADAAAAKAEADARLQEASGSAPPSAGGGKGGHMTSGNKKKKKGGKGKGK